MQIRIMTFIPLLEFSVRCAVEHAIVFAWLICMNGTSQYHHYQFSSLSVHDSDPYR